MFEIIVGILEHSVVGGTTGATKLFVSLPLRAEFL